MSFALRFRIACRKFVYFQGRTAKLGPQYLDCNERQTSCTRRKAQPRKGCPDCEYTIQYKFFLAELEKELKTLPSGTRKGERIWPTKKLLEQVSETASISASRKQRDPKWPVIVDIMVLIYRDEEAKKKTINAYQAEQAVPTNARESKERRIMGQVDSVLSADNAKDIGDFD